MVNSCKSEYLELQKSLKPSKRERIFPEDREASLRIQDFEEVSLGFTDEEALIEAERCLNCKNPRCVLACPVEINIPAFIMALKSGELSRAKDIINESHAFPCITGRVCPQESQCESLCILQKTGKPINIGKLERYVGDYSVEDRRTVEKEHQKRKFEYSVGLVGSGPSSLALAYDLLKMGIKPVIYEAFDKFGGVLAYGIPSFRLPRTIVKNEIEALIKEGLEVYEGVIIGKSLSLDDLLNKHDYVFIASGAGLPRFPDIPGTDSLSVLTANEFLTRINLLNAQKEEYGTPLPQGKKVCVIGGGNVAMDAARSAKRVYEEVDIFYRRHQENMSARIEEIEHAIEEGVNIKTGYHPLLIKDNKIIFGKDGKEETFTYDIIIMAIGTLPNKLMDFEKEGIATKNGLIEVDEHFRTSRQKVFAGGDIITGAATVIKAMESGKIVAREIVKDIKNHDR